MDKLYEKSSNFAKATSDKETGCCPRFNPKPWTDKEITWKDKLFVKDRVRSIFHIPINFGQVVVKNIEKVKNADASPAVPLMLSDENSLWGSDIYIAVSKNVPGAEMAKISGKFLSRVFEGPFQNCGKWAKEVKKYVLDKGKKLKKMYFFYTSCPACAKHYGKNYVVILAQI
ncbi:hypothetical protein FJY90_02660 [Candidatus Gottesmanbacteria bacterium]|nr:hypothetical protein [Candidatus Gottesmanbacteria bacterium]